LFIMAEDITKSLALAVRKAIADEWFAQYQYWIGAVIVDDENEDVVHEFVQHEQEEWDHATELAGWLRGIPRVERLPYSLSELPHKQHCGYIWPSGNTRQAVVNDAIKGEKCAINFYETTLQRISGNTYYGPDIGSLLEEILAKEKEHLRDLGKL